MNLAELLDRLRMEDEVTLLELLEVDSDQLVDAFPDFIQDNLLRLAQYYED